MNRKKELMAAFKSQIVTGGVYCIRNTRNNKFLLAHDINLSAVRNRFEFSVTTQLCTYHKLRTDWAAFGPSAFTFEILEEIEQKPEQSLPDFRIDLKALEDLCRENIGAGDEY